VILKPKSWWDPRDWIGANGMSQAELQAQSDALDAQRGQLNQGTYARIESQQGQEAADRWLDQVNQNEAASYYGTVEQQINSDFNEGASEGYDNVTGGIRSAINFPLRFIWDALPWWVWVGGAGALFWYLGGAVWIRRKVTAS